MNIKARQHFTHTRRECSTRDSSVNAFCSPRNARNTTYKIAKYDLHSRGESLYFPLSECSVSLATHHPISSPLCCLNTSRRAQGCVLEFNIHMRRSILKWQPKTAWQHSLPAGQLLKHLERFFFLTFATGETEISIPAGCKGSSKTKQDRGRPPLRPQYPEGQMSENFDGIIRNQQCKVNDNSKKCLFFRIRMDDVTAYYIYQAPLKQILIS